MRLPLWLSYLLLGLLLQTCVEPVVPEYDYQTGFFIVEGTIVDRAGKSSVDIDRSEFKFGRYQLVPVTDASVISRDELDREVTWRSTETPGQYAPDSTFAARPGGSYQLVIATATGELIESTVETVPQVVPITGLRMSFNQEAYFSNDRERFVPAFELLVNFKDPEGEDNFYQYYYQTWSRTSVCATCYGGVYRNGRCMARLGVDYYDYPCDRVCWATQTGTQFKLHSDALSPGANFRGVPAATIDYVNSGGILAEVQQYAIGRRAHNYYGEVQTLTDGNTGLNAPLPAALYGNLTDRSDRATIVLGYVAAASLSTERLYWNRDTIPGRPLSIRPPVMYEPIFPSPPTAPCAAPGFTPTRPTGWPN